jgi:hypothetical protein
MRELLKSFIAETQRAQRSAEIRREETRMNFSTLSLCFSQRSSAQLCVSAMKAYLYLPPAIIRR